MKKPNQPPYSTQLPDYYTFKDIFVGSVLVLNNFYFQLFDADEYCYHFMEQNNTMFPNSSLAQAVARLNSVCSPEALTAFEQNDRSGQGKLNFMSFYSTVKQTAGNNLTDQEIITLARGFSSKHDKGYDFQSMGAVAQDHLRKNNFEAFQKLSEVLHGSESFNQSDFSLSVNDTRCVLKGFRLPMPDYLLDMVLER